VRDGKIVQVVDSFQHLLHHVHGFGWLQPTFPLAQAFHQISPEVAVSNNTHKKAFVNHVMYLQYIRMLHLSVNIGLALYVLWMSLHLVDQFYS